MTDTITLVLADDHPIVLDGLEALFGLEEDFTVLARCTSGSDVVAAVRKHEPDVLVLDLRLPGMDGLAVLRALRDEHLMTRVVMLAAMFDEDQVVEALRLGVRGLVLKELAPPLLVQCIRQVHAGGQWIEQHASGMALDALLRQDAVRRDSSGVLTARELDLVRLAASGLRNKELADRLGISVGTVKMHLHNIYRKLGVDGRVALAVHARSKGLA